MPEDSREKLTQIETLVREWIERQGHEKCWYYPETLRAIAEVLDIKYADPTMVSEEEFRRGCARYQEEIYHTPTIEGRIPPTSSA